MNNRELRKVLNSGRSYLENEITQFAVMIMAIMVDAVLFYIALESTIVENWKLNLIVTVSGCFVVDISPLVLSKLLYKEMDKRIKMISCAALTLVLTIGLIGFFFVRWSSRYSLMGGSLGLVNDSSAMGAVETVAFVMGILPILSSIVVFAFGVLAHDPNKRKKDLIIAAHKSKMRELKYSKSQVQICV